MIFENHKIAYKNVVSKYYKFSPEDIDEAIQDFHRILDEQGYHVSGSIFYSLISEPTEEIMVAEIFLPIEENKFTNQSNEEMFFRSYFTIQPMIMTRVFDEFDEQSQVKYWELMNFIRQHGLEQRTPVFFEFKTTNKGKHYLEMSVGIKRELLF